MSEKNGAKSQFWLMKIPKWLADDWNSDNYLVNQPLAEMKFYEPKNPQQPPHITLESAARQETEARDRPTEFTLRQRQARKRNTVKNGELRELKENKLLVFYDKPEFTIGQKVEAQNINEKKYCPGVIEHISSDRKYNVYFPETDDRRSKAPPTAIRAMVEDPKATKCRLGGKIKSEFDVQPDRNEKYYRFTESRNQKTQVKVGIEMQEQKEKFQGSEIDRQKAAEEKIRNNKRQQAKQDKQSGRPKAKRVRREREVYEELIFRAFGEKAYMSKEELLKAVREDRWAFIKDLVNEFCIQHTTGVHKHKYSLRPEYSLADDAEMQQKEQVAAQQAEAEAQANKAKK